jgi:hypothetical protein
MTTFAVRVEFPAANGSSPRAEAAFQGIIRLFPTMGLASNRNDR